MTEPRPHSYIPDPDQPALKITNDGHIPRSASIRFIPLYEHTAEWSSQVSDFLRRPRLHLYPYVYKGPIVGQSWEGKRVHSLLGHVHVSQGPTSPNDASFTILCRRTFLSRDK